MLKIFVLCAANPATNPRPQRIIGLLKKQHKVYAMGICATPIEGVEVFSYPSFKKRNFFQELKLYQNVAFKKWQYLIHTPNRLEIIKVLNKYSFDLIICHDLVLLPIVLRYKGDAKVLFDAREFYPSQNSSNLRWKILFSKFNDYLCKTYLSQVDFVITVSKGLQEAYKKNYNIDCELFYSLPQYYNISPSPIDENNIKIIYHGGANPNRKIENMIAVSQHLQSRFQLDLMLVQTDKKYMDFLKNLVAKKQLAGSKINIIDPVSFENIIPFTSTYDIGLYSIPPTNFNLKHALPNKFFEYIQARLAIVIAPNLEMIPFIQTYQNGIIAKDFKPKTLANIINNLKISQIKTFKDNSNQAAKSLNLQNNQEKLEKIIKNLFS